ncbi:MAG: hypothetical protein JWM74_354 [Myxococcaceae bacterium]|nr:hypothetical protein [Myxococcaceae bacterium]
MIRAAKIAGTVALALVASLGCDRRQDTPSSNTNTTSGEMNKNAVELAHDGGHVGVATTTSADESSDFAKQRAEYKASVQTDIADADKRIAKLEERLTTEKDRGDRARIQRALPVIKAKRAALERQLGTLDNASSATWDTTKSKVGESWNDLKRTIDDAAR